MAKKRSMADDDGGGTAVAESPKRGRGRPPKASQPMLNDDPAFQRIKEIEDVANAYTTARDERQSLLEQEVELKKKLIEVMRKHDLEVYPFDGVIVVLEHIDEDSVKVKKKRAAKEDGSLA